MVEASQGYNNGVLDPGSGYGGITILLAHRWSRMVAETSTMLNNRAQYIVIRRLPSGDINFINVYAPNNSLDCIQLWKELMMVLPQNCRWLIAGDFNFVEPRQDKTNLWNRLLSLRERMIFGALKLIFNVNEPNRSTNSHRFFWDNFRSDGHRLLARLDWYYIFEGTPTASRNVISYKIKGDTGWSNHLTIEF